MRRPSERTTVFVCQSNWHLTRFSSLHLLPLLSVFSPFLSLRLYHFVLCQFPSTPHPLSLYPFHLGFLFFKIFFSLFSSWYLQTLRQQSLQWRWSPLWKRLPSLRPLLRPSHPHLQRGPGASGTPDRPPSSKQSNTIWNIYCTVYLPKRGHHHKAKKTFTPVL